MIPIGLILILAGFVAFVIGLIESEAKPPVAVGEQYMSSDPFRKHLAITVTATNGKWVKYREDGDDEGSFRSTELSTFHAWYPNKYVKSAPQPYTLPSP